MDVVNTEITLSVESETRVTREYLTQSSGWGWCSFGGLFGLVGGAATAFIGSALTAVSWIDNGGAGFERVLGTVLLCMTIPLLILGAHCLDVAENRLNKASSSKVDLLADGTAPEMKVNLDDVERN